MVKKLLLFALIVGLSLESTAQTKIARLKYNGGGDWYANATSLPNLIDFVNRNLGTNIYKEEDIVEVGSPQIFNYPFIHMTGHGNVVLSDSEAENLRTYLSSGGFIHIDDNYGMDEFIRIQLQKVFPDRELVELPFEHPIYRQFYNFKNGLPKVHEHDGSPPKGFGVLDDNGRVMIFYSYESDLGDGWENSEVHNDPEEIRTKALKMGANLIHYAFMYSGSSIEN